jgi:hypothetical protein
MRRSELEHVIRAAAAITNEYEIMVVGSQSILGAVPEPSALLAESMEADVYPVRRPDLADLIDGAIGEGSPFHERFGYYAQGVGPETAVLPRDWEQRLVKIQNDNTDLKVGLCLDPHDLAGPNLQRVGKRIGFLSLKCLLAESSNVKPSTEGFQKCL